MTQNPRGIRNNNPANIRTGNDWQGLQTTFTKDVPQDEEFAQFTHAYWGIRAAAKLLRNYLTLYKLNNIDDILHRFAPASENSTRSYISFVSKKTGYGPKDRLDLHSTDVMENLLSAIIRYECGLQPYDRELMRAAIQEKAYPGIEAASVQAPAPAAKPKAPAAPKPSKPFNTTKPKKGTK